MDDNIKKIKHCSSLVGEIEVPGDKSISHRAVMLGSIAEGDTTITGFLEGEDNLSTIEAFQSMGVAFERPETGKLVVKGKGIDALTEPEDVIDAGNSGTTTRLLMGILAGLPFYSVINGDHSLRKRPMRRVIEPLTEMGASIRARYNNNNLPVTIDGKASKLKAINIKTPIPSAQLKSAILLAGLFAEGETVVEESMKSRDHTEIMLELFGAPVEVDGNIIKVKKTDKLIGTDIDIPGDISSAAFFMVGAMITDNSELKINNVGLNPTRTGIVDILKKMGGTVFVEDIHGAGEKRGNVVIKTSALKGVEIKGEELLRAIDEFPAICIAASFATGRTVISEAHELRVKESDRIKVMADSLKEIGIKVEEKDDGIIIEGIGSDRDTLKEEATINSAGDHRVAMAMSLAGLQMKEGITIKDADCVDVSFPGFYKSLEKICK